MRVCLISDNPGVIPEIDLEAIALETVGKSDPLPPADLYIWDYHPGAEKNLEASTRPDGLELVLAEPHEAELLRNIKSPAFILLKPVNRNTFATYLRLALNTFDLQEETRRVAQLRSDRDTLLQYALEVNLKLQAYDQERGDFLARGVHDFRTPLTALHGYCGLLAEEKLGPVNARQKELLARMQYSALRLTRMARGMISLLTQGRFETIPQCNAADIDEALSQALHDTAPFVKDKRIEVRIDLQPRPGLLSFEAEQIQQVFINLIENSCKFVPQNGWIKVIGFPVHESSHASNSDRGEKHVRSRPEFYQIDISDSGPGVPFDLVDKIFEQYTSYRGSSDRAGGGLGLAICKLIVNAHKGAIWATAGSNGAKFSFRLPLKYKELVTPIPSLGDRPREGVAC